MLAKIIDSGADLKHTWHSKNPNVQQSINAIKKYGADAFDVELIPYPHISPEALRAVERWKIRQLNSYSDGYNCTKGGEGIDSETAREIQHQRVEDGTHHFLDGDFQQRVAQINRESNRQRVEDGTHHLLGGEIQRRRIEDGTHPFLDSEAARERSRRRIEDGTHNFLDGDFQQRVAQIARETSLQRVEDGTHNFLDGEMQRETNRRRVEDGTHQFLGRYRYTRILSDLAKCKYKIVYLYTLLIPKHYWDALNTYYRKRKLTREGFFDKDIPDTSQAEQVDFLPIVLDD